MLIINILIQINALKLIKQSPKQICEHKQLIWFTFLARWGSTFYFVNCLINLSAFICRGKCIFVNIVYFWPIILVHAITAWVLKFCSFLKYTFNPATLWQTTSCQVNFAQHSVASYWYQYSTGNNGCLPWLLGHCKFGPFSAKSANGSSCLPCFIFCRDCKVIFETP
jgi:hypothetical protein